LHSNRLEAEREIFCFFLNFFFQTEEIENFGKTKTELEAELKETRKGLGAKQEEINVVLAEITKLKASLEVEAPKKVEEKTKALNAEQENLNVCIKDVEAKKAGRQLRKNELSKGVTFYKERLGLSFERMPDNSLSFRLTLIDPENPARPFSFAVLVNSKNVYEVLRCEPKVDYDTLLGQLNKTNDFSAFVQQMRRLFKKMV
jgi:kinetochore protein Spc25